MVIARDRRSDVSRSILGGFTLRPVRPCQNRAPILPRRAHDPRRRRTRYVRRSSFAARVSTAAEMFPPRVFLVVEDLGCRDRPEDFLLDDRCAEVLDFVSPN